MLKRIMLFVTAILILSIFLSSCMLFQKSEKEINTNIVSAQLINSNIEFTSNVEANGIEVMLNIQDVSKKDVTFYKGMLGIVTNSSTCSKISVAKLKGTFSKGEPLFTINKNLYSLSNLKITAKYVFLPEVKILDNSTSFYPEGLSIGTVRTQINSDTKILIHAKDLKNVSGINLTLNYDPIYVTPKEKGEKLLYPTNGMMIVKPIKPGVLDVSVAFDNPIDIDDADFLQVTFVSSNSTGTSSIKFGDETEVLDSYLTKILCGIKNGTVVIDKTNLLGDFDGSGTVELNDFVNFAKHYDSSVGDNIYQPLYDIAPAQRAANGLWMVSQPDGVIDLKDFVVFAQNYLESVPSSALPETSPTNLSVSNPNSSCNSLELSWSYNSNDENGFEIWRSTDDTHFQKTLAVGTETAFTDEMLNSNTKYHYKIRAYSQGGYSSFSNTAFGTTTKSSPITPSSTVSYFPIHNGEVDEIQISLSNYFFGGVENSIFDPNQSLSCKEDISYFATPMDSGNIGYELKVPGSYIGQPNKFLYLYFKVSKTSSKVYWSPNYYYPHSFQDSDDYIRIIDGINGNTPGTIYMQEYYETISRTSYYLSQLSVGNKTYNNVLVVKLHLSPQSGDTPFEIIGYFARGIGIVKLRFYLCLEEGKVPIASAEMVSSNMESFQYSPTPSVLLSPNNKEYICSLYDVNLKWEPSDTGEKYDVYLNNEGDSIEEIKSGISATSTSVGKLSSGNYIWTVTTVSSNGLSTISNPLKFSVLSPDKLPNSPTNLKVTSFASTHITLEWQDNNSDWMYFAIKRSTDDTNFTEISTTTNLTYNDTSVSSGVKYYYEVKAVNYAGYSQPSNVVSMKAMEDGVVTFPDPNLEKVIRTALNKLSGDIHLSDLLTLTSLNNSWPGGQYRISNLEGIQYCTNLTSISFIGNSISDISPLASLANLQSLSLSYNKISNISPLRKLVNLRELYLFNNNISDISPLKNLNNLQEIELSNNKIKDINSLQNLIKLRWIELRDNEISDITPLVNNTGIDSGDYVDLSSNFLDLSLTSNDMKNISTLVSRGVSVSYNNQKTHPNTPYNLQIVSFSSTNIKLRWGDDNSDWMYFAIKRSTDDTNFTEISTTTNLTYNDTSVSSGVKYYYEVKAVNPLGYSSPTNVVKAYAINDSEVNVPDSRLKQAILFAIGKPYSTIVYMSDLLTLTDLDAVGDGIQNLEGIQYCTNLRKLNLSNNNITNISNLASLTNLRELYLDSNQIDNIVSLQNLAKLQKLSLNSNKINNIAPLQNLTNLQVLNLMNNQISSATSLQNLTNLQELYLDYNQITNATPLQNLVNLRLLSIMNNKLANIIPIEKLTKLQKLYLGSNQINDITPLQNLTSLQELGLDYNQITSATPLQNLTNLQELILNNNQISDITSLQNLIKLQHLGLYYNRISDIAPLQGLVNLTSLDISSNHQINNITPLQNLTNLQELHLDYEKIKDITPLQNLTNLRILTLSYNDIANIAPLVNNNGINEGDTIKIDNNYLDLSPNSTALNNIQALENRGVNVTYHPQKTKPTTPYELTVVSFSSTKIVLQWNEDGNNYDYFEVERSTDNTFTHSFVATVTTTTYEDTDLSSGTTYYYKVRAYNPGGYSDWSSIASMKAMEDSVITFPDPNLERVIRLQLNILTAPLHKSDLMKITTLQSAYPSDEYKISNLEGIQYCTNLTSINFNGNNISDLSSLASLANLIALNLNGNNISNILPLQKLTNLYSLDISSNKIKNLSSLQNLTNLGWLNLMDNEISDITPLVNNTGIDSGDYVGLSSNFLDLFLTSDDMENISTLVGRGVNVSYNNQKTHPTTPYNLQIASFSSTNIKLRWNDDNNDWNSFVIRRSTDDTNFATLTSVSTTNYEDTDVSAGTTYYYEVQSCNPIAHSDWSYAVSAVATDQ